MNHTAFFASIKSGSPASAYLFEGVEEYIKRQALKRLCESLLPEGLEQMNLTELNDPDVPTLIAACETLPFACDRRVVVARECEALVSGRKKEDEGTAAGIIEYLGRISPSVCLVFYVKGKADGRKKLYSALKKSNSIVDFSPMNDSEAAAWAVKTMRAMGKTLPPGEAQALVFTVGRDAALLKQEMEKLRAYTGCRESVTLNDIDAICVKSLECTVFQMVDAQVAGDAAGAMRLMRGMLTRGEDAMGIMAMLLRQYRLLYHMKRLMAERAPQAALASLLGLPPFAVNRTQAQARRYSEESLKAAYDYLFELEYGVKSGRVPQEGIAEHALLTLPEVLKAR